MNNPSNIRHDASPGELDPELMGLVAQLECLGAADRASANAAMESLIVERTSPELHLARSSAPNIALDPLPIVIPAARSSRLALRIAAAIAFAGVALSVYLASLSSPAAPTVIAENTPAATEVSTHLATAAMVSDWVAVSSLYEDNSISSDIDILSAEVSRLHSSLDDSADAATGTAGGAM